MSAVTALFGHVTSDLDRFFIREVAEALMHSRSSYYLRLLIHARPLVSVAVSGDRHSVSYSPLGSTRSGPALSLQIRSYGQAQPDCCFSRSPIPMRPSASTRMGQGC